MIFKSLSHYTLNRELFTSEHSKLTRKYGRYCINYSCANKIIKKYFNYFSCYQFENEGRVHLVLVSYILE